MMTIREEITRTRQRQGTNSVGVPCAATEMTRAQNARGKIQQKMKGFVNRTDGRSKMPDIKNRLTDVGYQDYLAQRMKEICDKLYKFGTATNKEDENMCAIGKALIDEALRSSKQRRSKSLMSWIDQMDKLIGRCRWIECRPERLTSVLTRANQQLADIRHAWKMFDVKVRMANGMCRKLTPGQEAELQRLVKREEAVHAFIEDNCEQIIFEHENVTDSRKNDIKTGDKDDDKTIKTSNKWNREAAQGQ